MVVKIYFAEVCWINHLTVGEDKFNYFHLFEW